METFSNLKVKLYPHQVTGANLMRNLEQVRKFELTPELLQACNELDPLNYNSFGPDSVIETNVGVYGDITGYGKTLIIVAFLDREYNEMRVNYDSAKDIATDETDVGAGANIAANPPNVVNINDPGSRMMKNANIVNALNAVNDMNLDQLSRNEIIMAIAVNGVNNDEPWSMMNNDNAPNAAGAPAAAAAAGAGADIDASADANVVVEAERHYLQAVTITKELEVKHNYSSIVHIGKTQYSYRQLKQTLIVVNKQIFNQWRTELDRSSLPASAPASSHSTTAPP